MELFQKPAGVEARWVSFENPSGARGRAALENAGSKGHAFDCVRAGETKTLLDIEGSGSIRRIWMTINDRSPEMLRSLRLDFYWDGAAKAAVSVPFGDFFGIGLGRRVKFESALFSDPEGRSFNCFIPMPFRKSASMTITNESAKDLPLLFYDIDLLVGETHGDDVLYFHASWRREAPNALGEEFTILPTIKGSGRFLGSNIGVIADPRYEGAWWGEGEVKAWFGDDENPTLCGTGTEDYIGTAWGQGTYANRTQGCPIADEAARIWTFYRYHLDDPIYFDGSCRVAIQTIGGNGRDKVHELRSKGVPVIPVSIDNGEPGGFFRLMDLPLPVDLTSAEVPKGWCNFWRQDDWSATAYYYLDSPEGQGAPLAPAAERTARLETEKA